MKKGEPRLLAPVRPSGHPLLLGVLFRIFDPNMSILEFHAHLVALEPQLIQQLAGNLHPSRAIQYRKLLVGIGLIAQIAQILHLA